MTLFAIGPIFSNRYESNQKLEHLGSVDKTKILNNEEAQKEFDGIQNVIAPIQAQLIQEFPTIGNGDDGYLSEVDLLNALQDSDSPPVDLLEAAFTEHIDQGTFNKTLFHHIWLLWFLNHASHHTLRAEQWHKIAPILVERNQRTRVGQSQ